jgi:hypothetical protein
MRDGMPPRSGRGAGANGQGLLGRQRGQRPEPQPRGFDDDPYRPYGEGTNTRVTAQRNLAATGNWTAASMASMTAVPAAPRHHLGIAIFHDGNPGHLWRGSVASNLAEAVLGVGAIMWLADFTQSPVAVALAVVALGLPFLLAGPMAARFENAKEPRTPLKWVGRLRLLFVLGLIAMHYHTILLAVYALLFVISYCGRLHDALRTAAIRTCLAPGEPEHVANDIAIGSALSAVLGPLLATLFYLLLGQRILLVGIGGAILCLISMNSENFLDALPEQKRAFLLATPETAHADATAAGLPDVADDEDEDDAEARRELGLPEWYQQGPKHAFQAMADLRAGLGLAGGATGTSVALWALGALAFVGGGLAALEVFYITGVVLLPAFYLGPLLAAEGGGLALGVLWASGATAKGSWRGIFLVGIVGSGVALLALASFPIMPVALAIAFVLGLMNALAVSGARYVLLAGFDGVERRAIASAEGWIGAFCGVLGALAFIPFLADPTGAPFPLHLPVQTAAMPAGTLLSLTGIAVMASGIVFGMLLNTNKKRTAKARKKGAGASTSKGRVPGATGEQSAYLPAADDDGWGDTGMHTGMHGWNETGEHGWGDTGMHTGAHGDPYAESRVGYDTTGYRSAADLDAYDDQDYDDPRGSSSRRGPQRPRW